MIIGNETSVSRYAREFPRVAVLFGPSGVGKWSLVEEVRRERKIFEPDVLRVRKLSAATGRDLVNFLYTHPATPAGKIAIIDTEYGSADVFNTLLKPLEEIAPNVHVALVSSRILPSTILTRADVYRFGLLTDAEVAQALQMSRGMSEAVATRLARGSGGQVSRAMSLLLLEDEKVVALAALRAVRDSNAEALLSLADRWDEAHTKLLAQACSEGVSGQWKVFSAAEIGDVHKSVLLRILMALRKDVRPRLVIRSSLMSVLKEAQP